jgi:hypothetical protein
MEKIYLEIEFILGCNRFLGLFILIRPEVLPDRPEIITGSKQVRPDKKFNFSLQVTCWAYLHRWICLNFNLNRSHLGSVKFSPSKR